MELRSFDIEGVYEIIPEILSDDRGRFFESYHHEKFSKLGIPGLFVQDNQSFSKKNVLRGLHFQYPPYAQGKLVRVIQGKALDIAVDLRSGSASWGKYVSCELDDLINNMIYIPPGFAHGFLALSDTVLVYKVTRPYHGPAEGGILWNDPALAIDWGTDHPVLSTKDRALPDLNSVKKALSRIKNS